MSWFLYREDGHNELNTDCWGGPIPEPPLEIQVLVRQKERIDAVLVAYADMIRSDGIFTLKGNSIESY